MSFSHQLQTIKNPSRNAIAVQNRGTKRSSDMQYEDALEVSDDDASMDSDSNWKHKRNLSKVVDGNSRNFFQGVPISFQKFFLG